VCVLYDEFVYSTPTSLGEGNSRRAKNGKACASIVARKHKQDDFRISFKMNRKSLGKGVCLGESFFFHAVKDLLLPIFAYTFCLSIPYILFPVVYLFSHSREVGTNIDFFKFMRPVCVITRDI